MGNLPKRPETKPIVDEIAHQHTAGNVFESMAVVPKLIRTEPLFIDK